MMNIKKLFNEYLMNTYTRVGPVFVRGKGSWLWDDKGNKYLDLFPGWGVSVLGHAHPRIVRALHDEAKQLMHLPNNLYQPQQALLAKEVVARSFSGKVFFANSGAEAVEGAIKFSRLFGQSGRYEIITMKNSFHGRSFGALSATGQKKYKHPFRPIVPGFKEARFNDFSDFKKKVSKKTVAVLLELIQGEGGVNIADKAYIQKLKKFCRSRNILLMVDEVQTGMGRTGKLFCYQHYGLTPDVMVLSKGLGGGFPVSCFVVRKTIAGVMKPGHHASTFGGNPPACRVAREVFKVIKEEKLLDHTLSTGSYLKKALGGLKKQFPLIKEIRAKGLMVGLALTCDSAPLFSEALKRKLIINATHGNVLRIMPALNVKKSELNQGLAILGEVFKNHTEK